MMGEECKVPVNTRQVESMILINKFSSLALEFKTDRLTLQERLDVQRRHRDQAEHNLELEMQRLRDHLMLCGQSGEEGRSQAKALQHQVDIITQISLRLASVAEVLGAVQQELRVSHAVEVMTEHVESLRHLYEREHSELAQARRLLVTHRLVAEDVTSAARSTGLAGRRASIAVLAAPPGGADGDRAESSGKAATPALSSGGVVSSAALRRRRKSLDGSEATAFPGFACIAEEREEETQQEEVSQLPTPEMIEHLQRFATARQEESVRAAAETAVSDELVTLRSEQEQLAQDLRRLLSDQAGASRHTDADRGRSLWALLETWPYSWEETAAQARLICGGLFLVLALVVLLLPPVLHAGVPG